MKTNQVQIPRIYPWPFRTTLARDDRLPDWHQMLDRAPSLSTAVTETGCPAGWMERTLLAVDTGRVFIDAPDPAIRGALVAAFEAGGHDVIAAGSSQALLTLMEQLPIPDELSGDVVVVEDEHPGTIAAELLGGLRALGWSIPALVVPTLVRSTVVVDRTVEN